MSGVENRVSSAAASCSKHAYNRRHHNNYQVLLLRFSLLAKSNVKKVPQPTTSQKCAQFVVDFGIETP
jgi:hypothetical protein